MVPKIVFLILTLLCLTPWITPPLALLMGIVVALTFGEPFKKKDISQITHWLLKASVVGLGFGMNFFSAVKVGETGLTFSLISIFSTLALGFLLGKWLAVDKKITILISSGTAICGGSAIAAISPIIEADNYQMSIALGIVFILNAIALLIFPPIGHMIHLSQTQFGYWAGIAIHDTSSVVGAASAYGAHALEVATSVKLGRALWIIPLSLGASFVYNSEFSNIAIPYFIFLFIGAMLLNTLVPGLHHWSAWITPLADKGLTMTLFFIGSGLTMDVLKNVGIKPLVKGVLLWFFIAGTSLWVILSSM